MRRQAKALSAASTGGTGTVRGLFGLIPPRRSALIAGMVLVACLGFGVSAASAAPPTATIDPNPSAGYTTAEISGTVDPGTQEISLYAEYRPFGSAGPWTEFFLESIEAGKGPTPVTATITGIPGGTKFEVRLDAFVPGEGEFFSPGPNPTFTTDPVATPTVSIDPVTTFTGTTAKFTGQVNPNSPEAAPASPAVEAAFKTSWHFHCSPECPGLEGGEIAADNSSHTVEVEAEGLQPNLAYEVTLIAENAGGPGSAGPEGWMTDAAAPTAVTSPAHLLADGTKALIGGRVNPNNQPTTYWVEYGTTAAYDLRFPVTGDADAGSGGESELLAEEITGLAPATTYHFQIVAENTTGRTPGGDRTFQTPATAAGCPNEQVRSENDSLHLPECRAYELVTPPDTNNGDVEFNLSGVTGTVVATPNANHVAYSLNQAFGDISGFGVSAGYLASRATGDWQSLGIQPPSSPNAALAYSGIIEGLTTDLSKEVVLTNIDPTTLKPLPGSAVVGGTQAIYLRDNTTGTYRLVMPIAASEPQTEIRTDAAITPEGQAVFVSIVVVDYRSGTPVFTGSVYRYETATGQLENVAILPDGSESASAGPAGGLRLSANSFSSNGNVFFFSDDASRTVYRRDLGTQTTVPINASENGGQVVPLGEASAEGASTDGTRAFFASSQPLVDGDTNGVRDLYLYDATKPAGERLTAVTTNGGGSSFGKVIEMSSDGRRVYFTDEGRLVPGVPSPPAFGGNLYLWDDTGSSPVIKYIASLDSGGDALATNSSIAAGGRFFAFLSASPGVTANNTAGLAQIYLYQADSSTATSPDLVCPSCVAPPGVSTAEAEFQKSLSRGNTWGSGPRRSISASGQLFFETQEPLVPQDTNGRYDVYEYANGQAHLISSGRGDNDAYFGDATANAEDVYIYSANRLTPTASGENIALYDARVGGGFTVPPGSSPCLGDQCHGPTPTPPTLPTVGSVAFGGKASGSAKASVGVKRVRATGSTARLKVQVPAAGRISVAASQIRAAHKSVSKAGSYSMGIALKPQARKRLRASSSQSLQVKVRVSFRAQGGRSASKTVAVTFKQPRPKRAKAEAGGR